MGKVISYGDKGRRYPTKSPFILIGYHKDAYPAGNEKMEPTYYIDGRDIGQDFDPKEPWRMYHGDKVPGFPAHPHRGFETVTIVEDGVIDHTDGLGGNGRYAKGDVQWLTAGAGVQHCEMFPLVNDDRDNPFEIFQLWLNLPKKSKMVSPHYKMIWNETIPTIEEKDAEGRDTSVRVIHGTYKDTEMRQSTPDSWAADPANGMRILLVKLTPGATLTLDAASDTAERMLYYYRGDGLAVEDVQLPHDTMWAELAPGEAITLTNGDSESRVLILEGNPIDEPVVAYGPFVMNSREEIMQAYEDYSRTEFGGWKWDESGPVHAKDKGRYAQYSDGTTSYPTDK